MGAGRRLGSAGIKLTKHPRIQARLLGMVKAASQAKVPRVDIPSIEADMAFFEARLSLADHAPDTAYQRAQIKTYQTLGILLGSTLSGLRAARDAATPSPPPVTERKAG